MSLKRRAKVASRLRSFRLAPPVPCCDLLAWDRKKPNKWVRRVSLSLGAEDVSQADIHFKPAAANSGGSVTAPSLGN